MENTADDVRAVGAKVSTYTCDVSRADDIKDVAERLREDVGGVDVLVNNAGVLNGGTILEMTSADIRKTFEVNTLAQFWVSTASVLVLLYFFHEYSNCRILPLQNIIRM